MVELPMLKSRKEKIKKYTYSFGGINNSANYSTGEFEDSENVSLDKFPYISVGKKSVSENVLADDLLYADGIARVVLQEDGTNQIYFRPEKSGSNWKSNLGDLTVGKKEIATAGGKVLVMPDKKVLDLSEAYPTWRSIEKEVAYSQQAAMLYGSYMVFKNVADFNTFKNAFKVGDVISYTGGYFEGNETAKYWTDKKFIIREISNTTQKKVTFDPYIFGETNANETTDCIFKKTIPTLTCLCSWGGRVWGVSADGKIYGSKYSDPTNFEYFDMSSIDSYTIEVGSGGAFTGSCDCGNYVAFFRENKIHRITGTKPSNFRHTSINQRGIKSGSGRSLAIINNIVYYEGTDGIYAFDGAEAHLISRKLGDITHSGGVGVARGNKYYISLKTGTQYTLYVYDTEKNIWLKESNTRFKGAVNFLGEAYFLDDSGTIKKMSNSKSTEDYSVTLREFLENDSEQKGWSRLYISAKLNKGGKLKVEVDYGFGFEPCGTFTNYNKTVFEIRLKPNRGDEIKLRLCASSGVVIMRMMREHYVHGSVF